MRSPNGKAVGHRRGGQPTPTATPLRNAHVIEERDRGVGTERAHTKSEYDQAIVVLLREAIQYSEHGFPQLCERQLLPKNIYTCVSGGSSKPFRSVARACRGRKGCKAEMLLVQGMFYRRHDGTAMLALTL